MGELGNIRLTEKLTRHVYQSADVPEGPLASLRERCPKTPWSQLSKPRKGAKVRYASGSSIESNSDQGRRQVLQRTFSKKRSCKPQPPQIQNNFGTNSFAAALQISGGSSKIEAEVDAEFMVETDESASKRSPGSKSLVASQKESILRAKSSSTIASSYELDQNQCSWTQQDPTPAGQTESNETFQSSHSPKSVQDGREPAGKCDSTESSPTAVKCPGPPPELKKLCPEPPAVCPKPKCPPKKPCPPKEPPCPEPCPPPPCPPPPPVCPPPPCPPPPCPPPPCPPPPCCPQPCPPPPCTKPKNTCGKCPKGNPCKCPPHRRLKPEVCNPQEIQKARVAAACAARQRLESLCAPQPAPSTTCQQPNSCSAGSSRSGSVATDCKDETSAGSAQSAGSAEDNLPCSPPGKPDCGPQPDGNNMCEGLDGVQVWQQQLMEKFLDNHRQWRHGEQPGTPARPRPKSISRPPIELPDNVQEFVDRVTAGRQDGCEEGPVSLCTPGKIMDEVEHRTVLEIKCSLEQKGAATYGIPNDPKIDYIHLLTQEVWCERSRVSLELKMLRKMLERATAEAEEAQKCAENAFNSLVPGAQDTIDCWIKEYKKIMECLRPLRDRRSMVHHKALTVCRSVRDATEVLHGPLAVGISAFTAKRTGESPVGHMMSNLGSDLMRSAYGLFGIEFAKCTNFAAKLGSELEHELVAASWASVALCEYLQLRGPHFPRVPESLEEMNCEGPVPPRKPVPYQKWATMRDTYLLYREASYFRTVLKSHDFIDKEAACAFPAFPEKDRKCIFHGYVSGLYLEDNVGLWQGRWAIRNAILNRSMTNPIG